MEELRKIIKIRFDHSLRRYLNPEAPKFRTEVLTSQQQPYYEADSGPDV